MPSKNVERAALGRMAKIGALYDIRTESFLGDTVFASKLEEGIIDTDEISNTTIEIVKEDSIREKCKTFEIGGELKLSVLSGLVKLKGSGSYVGENRTSARAQSMSLIYKVSTKSEEIMIRHHKDKIDRDILASLGDRSTDATHVVVGIDWGAVCSITCEYENTENKDVTKVKGDLSVEVKKLQCLIQSKQSGKASYDKIVSESERKFTFKCRADIAAPDKDLPVTFEGVVELARSLPNLVKDTNNGKGVPLTYTLMPLERVALLCKSQEKLGTLYKEIDEGTIEKCVQVFEVEARKRQVLYDIHHDMHDNEVIVSDESLKEINDIFGKSMVEESSFRYGLQEVMKKVRSGQDDVSIIEKYLRELENRISFPVNALNKFRKVLTNVNRVKLWESKGIKYISKKNVWSAHDTPIAIVLYKTSGENFTHDLEKNMEFFLRLQTTHCADDKYGFYVVEQEIRQDLWPETTEKSTIRKYVEGTLKSKDLYAEEGQDSEMCLLQIGKTTYCVAWPSNRAYVNLPCPNSLSGTNRCDCERVNWKCKTCRIFVEYGIDTESFYCKCGQSDPSQALFRCNDKNHDMSYDRYPDDILRDELSYHNAANEINILILGETGVGKSTWINAFHNYLFFADLNEAAQSEQFNVLIPSSFSFTQANGEQTNIKVGEDDPHEEMEVGKSGTREPRSHVFNVDGTRVRLIDTPGIGDSGGIEKDRVNLDKILSYLSYYQEIHVVCIVLKSNNAILTERFRFCIQELLVQLHTSAKDNVVFCFTNARGTFYQPGDTLPALNKELRDRKVGIQATTHNYFCFDNEAFRFLACVKNGVKFQDKDTATYAESWKISVEETTRLFQYAEKLRPHKIRDTLSLNEARRIIVAMSKPLAEVARTIQQNIDAAEETKTEIELVDHDLKALEKSLKFDGFNLEKVELEFPRTVCADSHCVTFVSVGASRAQNVVYRQICHDHCGLTNVITGRKNNQLKLCSGIRGYKYLGRLHYDGMCRQCDHHYTSHMHLTYDTKMVVKQFLSPDIQKAVKEKGNLKSQKEKFIKEVDTQVEELRREENAIMKIGAKYRSFLKKNALIVYNDAVGDYLDLSIEHEGKKPKTVRNAKFLSKLIVMKEEYIREKQILDDATDMGDGQNIRNPEEVMTFQEELFKLKHFGPTLKRLFNDISITNSANNPSFGENHVAPTTKKKKPKSIGRSGTSDTGAKLDGGWLHDPVWLHPNKYVTNYNYQTVAESFVYR